MFGKNEKKLLWGLKEHTHWMKVIHEVFLHGKWMKKIGKIHLGNHILLYMARSSGTSTGFTVASGSDNSGWFCYVWAGGEGDKQKEIIRETRSYVSFHL
jgi:hypothetical protein